MNRTLKIAESMLDLIGDIPLVRLNRIGRDLGTEILVKPEFLNPSGSIKDRIAKRMIETAEAEGLIGEGSTIIEATTGNTGTALSFVAAVKGYPVTAYSPGEVANRSRAAIMQAYGTRLEIVDATGTDAVQGESAIHGGHAELLPRQICRDLERADRTLWWARQFSNPDNVAAHREWTGREILEQTEGRLDAFVASVGTGGTILGIAQALKGHNPLIKVVGVEPAGAPMLADPDSYPFIPGISDGIIPEIIGSGLIDDTLLVTDAEAIAMAHQLATQEGIFAGISSGANVVACLRVAAAIGPTGRIVTVLPDSRDRYLEVEVYST